MDCHRERINKNGLSKFPQSPKYRRRNKEQDHYIYSFSLINSNEPTLVAVHVSCAQLNPSFPLDSQIYLTKNQSNYTVVDAKTFILPNLHDTGPSMVLILEPPSHISSFSSTQLLSHQRMLISFNKPLSSEKTMVHLI